MLKVIKGVAGTVEQSPHEIDGLSGATITSRGVSDLIQFWLGDHGFKKYIQKLKSGDSHG